MRNPKRWAIVALSILPKVVVVVVGHTTNLRGKRIRFKTCVTCGERGPNESVSLNMT